MSSTEVERTHASCARTPRNGRFIPRQGRTARASAVRITPPPACRMMARLLDGKATTAVVRAEVAEDVRVLRAQVQSVRLDVILVGEDPASVTYVRNKQTDCAEVGIGSQAHRFPEDVTHEELEIGRAHV